MQFFRMMRILDKKKLEPQAQIIFDELVVAVENCGNVIAPHSKVADDILFNWRLNAEEIREWYEVRNVYKSASTIRSEIQLFSNTLSGVYMSPDIMLTAFESNDAVLLKEIQKRNFALTHAGVSYKDFEIDLSSVMKLYEDGVEYQEDEINAAIDFLNILKRSNVEQLFKKANPSVIASVLKTLTEPLISMKEYEIADTEGRSKKTTRTEFNEEQMSLLIKMEQRNRKITEPKMPIQEKIVERVVYKEEPLPFKDFLSMKEIADILLEYSSCQNPTKEDFIRSGKTLAKAEQLMQFYTNPKAILSKVNPFDLSAVLEQHKR